MSTTLRALRHTVLRITVLRNAALGGLAAALFAVTASGQAGPASEANHFIETPKSWAHPKTPWGDPDLTGMWPISFVGTVPLERCRGGGRHRRQPNPPRETNTGFFPLSPAQLVNSLRSPARASFFSRGA